MSNPQDQATLERFGFVVVPAIADDDLGALRRLYADLGPAPDDPQLALNWTFHSQSRAHKIAVKERLLAIVGPVLDRLLVDHVSYLPTFITKWPGPNSAFAPHQDPTLVDERSFRGVNVWIPLADTGVSEGRDNGMLHVVPGSHLLPGGLRTSDVDQFGFVEHESAILARFGRGVPMAAGEALVFDNRLIHYSLPNLTDGPRVVASFGMRHRDDKCVILRDDGAGMLDVHQVDDDFYFDVLPAEQHLWSPPDPPITKVPRRPGSITSDEFVTFCEAVGEAPRAVPLVGAPLAVDPGAFCSLCGSSEGLTDADRVGRNNAQLVCPTCREQLATRSTDPAPLSSEI